MTIGENPALIKLYWAIGFFAGSMFYPVWLIFVTNLITFKHKSIKYFFRILLILSALTSMMVIFFGDVSFTWTTFGNQFSYQNNLLFNILFLYSILLSGVLLFIHIKWLRQSELKRNKRQVLIIIISSTLLLPIALLSEYIIPIYSNFTVIPVASLTILPTSFFIIYTLRKYKLLGVSVSNVSQYTFTSVKMPIYVLDYKDRIVIENNAAIDCLGESAIGKSISEYFLVDGETPGESFFKDDFIGESVDLKAVSGIRICDMSLTIEKDNYNDAICKVVVFTDMTAIKEMEKSSAEALYEALEANKVKSDFLAKMSHEIRTPMNAIIGMTELVLRENTSNIVREHTITIRQASENLLSLINDLLDFSKIESGNMQILQEHYSLSSLINDVVNIIKIRLSFSTVRFIVDLSKDIPNVLIGDVAKIRQILINILGNAVKHTRHGHIKLIVKGDSINEESLDLVLIIEDTGRGIKQENIESLFTEYYQVQKTSDGVGLGLAITRGFILAMDGDISVESEYGKGSVFSVMIPQKIGDLDQQAAFEIPSENDEDTLAHGRISVFSAPDVRVLIVDDINTNLKVASGLLKPYNMIVDTCLSGEEAIDMVRNCKYDLILMDYRMPEMDGVEATEKIRALDPDDPYYSTLPIVALTADAVTGRREMLLESGFNDFISKPINKNELNSVLEKLIPKHLQSEPVITDTEEVDSAYHDAMIEAIGGLDIAKGITLSGGRIEHYYETLASFHSDALERLELLRDYLISKDFDRYITIIHALKSASANVGANEVSLLAAGLENAGLSKDWLYLENNNEILVTALEKLLESIQAALKSHDENYAKNVTESDSGSNVDIHRKLDSLKSALSEMDIVSTNEAVDSLLKLARSEEEKKIIREISHHVLLFEYDKACILIDKIK